MINQLGSIESSQRSHHEYCETHFQHLEEQVEDTQGKLGQMFYGWMTSGHTAFCVCSPPFDELNEGEIIVCFVVSLSTLYVS